MCLPCPVGFYQPLSKQHTCLQCPLGTTSNFEGASICKGEHYPVNLLHSALTLYAVCPSGTYGQQCKSNCSECVHGKCHAGTGDCICESGWEGPACDIGKYFELLWCHHV
ncbi:hypothetical protein CAPTEDRAFT_112495 [Capitella teleta]|uniref:EGF-like domain-containing protein n=1 Tax=Capitella teleta TaxID=283909 RepID=R7TUM1_CAPTE|nr:hypothetical protein CAPTEDRAFT_112495 [Capitella teleta]|eukprot:ELT94720.1 hypothetical protein CAPTEDRAFT_112495 [Capitella teleta]